MLVFWSICVLVSRAWAEPALDKPPYTATPQELLAAAKALPGDEDLSVLREDYIEQFDAKKRLTVHWHIVAAIRTQHGAESWDSVTARYSPSRQDRPVVRGRVIDPAGKVVEVDLKQATDEPIHKAAGAISEARAFEVPLPKLVVGGVIEEDIVTVDREPTVPSGSALTISIPADHETHVTVSAPVAIGMKRVEHALAGVRGKRLVANGVETWTYAFPRRAELAGETWLPADVYDAPWLGFSAVESWTALARDLRAIAERQLAAGPAALPAKLQKGATLANARAITSWLQHEVQSTGLPIKAGPFLPAPPAETLRAHTADDAALALVLVALLRQADIPADLALVNEAVGPDAEPELAMFGEFDRVLVRARIANADVWIDPINDTVPAGVLGWSLRHRRALVLAASPTALVSISALTASENVVNEVRTFEFPDAGGAHVTEVRRASGFLEGEERQWFRERSRDELTKKLTQMLTQRYAAEKIAKWSTTDPTDLATPFETTYVIDDARRAIFRRESIDAWVFPIAALVEVPSLLRDKGDPRRADFEWLRPHVDEVENRFVIPEGFEMPALADETRSLGAAKLTRTHKVAGQVLTVTYRFETTKPRLTAAELDATRTAILAITDESLHLVFPSTVRALFARGKVRESIAEANRLIQAHPKIGRFHALLAENLVESGLGDAARREARLAVQLEPSSADLHAILGWVLAHDTTGRYHAGDHDPAGARVELERARKLDPKHAGAAAMLGDLLERDATGALHEKGADLAGALVAWRAAFELDDSKTNTEGVMRVLLWTGAGGDLVKFARAQPEGETRNAMLVAGAAISSGVPGALQEAGGLGSESARKAAVTTAAGMLFYTRRYTEMIGLFDAVDALPQGSAQSKVMHGIRRVDKPLDRKAPMGATVEAELDFFAHVPTKGFWDAQTEKEVGDDVRAQLGDVAATLSQAVIADTARSQTAGKVEGDLRGWRVDIDIQGAHGQTYAVQDRGVIKIIGTDTRIAGVGRHVLRLVAGNDLASARRLLDWAIKDSKRAQLALREAWGPNHPTDALATQIAGAILAGDSDTVHALPILERCEGASPAVETECVASVYFIELATAAYKDLDANATARLAAKPNDRLGTMMKISAQARLGNSAEADRLAEAALANAPDDKAYLRLHAETATYARNFAEAVKRTRVLSATEPSALNEEAWLDLLANADVQDGLAKAQQAVQKFPKSAAVFHTLASLEAEVGDVRSAIKHLHDAIRLRRTGATDADWYVIGRIAEQLGYRSDASAAYRRMQPAKSGLPDTYDLAQRRLAVVGAP